MNIDKETLEFLILIEKRTYESIGKEYGVSGNAIKKKAKKLGIELPNRRKINPIETFNKKEKKCLFCGTSISSENKFCSQKCSSEYRKKDNNHFCEKHNAYQKQNKNGKFRCKQCAIEATQKRRDKIKLMSVDYKGGKCQKCGYDKCIGALEFHHLDSNEKEFAIGSKGYTRSWEKVKEELDKCILLCANCHREEHNL